MHIVVKNSWHDLFREEEGITFCVRSLVFHNTHINKVMFVWSSNESAVTSMNVKDSLYKTYGWFHTSGVKSHFKEVGSTIRRHGTH